MTFIFHFCLESAKKEEKNFAHLWRCSKIHFSFAVQQISVAVHKNLARASASQKKTLF